MRKTGAVALALCLGLAALAAQQPTFKSGTQVVSVFATVTDAQKRLVPDLAQDDFEVLDNEKPQPLVFFENEVQPISVVVMLDTSGSMTLTLDLLRHAAEEFVIRLLPADQARVGAFNDKIQFNSRFMNDRDQLVTDIKNLDYGNGTRLWDAIAASLDELKGIDGRRVILVFTDGDDTESRNSSLGKVIDRARAEEVMIYAIGSRASTSTASDGTSKPDSGLRKIADETGGGYFELDEDERARPRRSRASRRSCTASTCSASRRRMLDGKVHKLARAREEAGHERPRAPQLSRRHRQRRRPVNRHTMTLTDQDFRVKSDEALEQARRALLPLADQEGFEVEFSDGTLNLMFDEPSEARFVVSPERARAPDLGVGDGEGLQAVVGSRRPARSRSTGRRSPSCSIASPASF